MSDFATCLITDSTIADIDDKQMFAVQTGASSLTQQQFQATSASASSLVFSVQIPSESIVVDRKVLIQSNLAFTLTCKNVPVGEQCFNLGQTDSLGPFPLNSLFNTVQCSINNCSVSVNLNDIFSTLLRLNNNRELYAYNSMTASMPDAQYLHYSDGTLTNNNPLGSYKDMSYDLDLAPRGSHPVSAVISQYDATGVYISNSPICATTGNYFKVEITTITCEPLVGLSPFIFGDPTYNKGGMLGVNTISMVMNIDSTAKRLFRTASPYDVSIQLGTSSNSNPFSDTRLLFSFLSLQPTQLVKSRCVLPFFDYPRYISSANNALIGAGETKQITSNNIQLSMLPDYFYITIRKPINTMTIKDSDSFFPISRISVNLNNANGLISGATQYDLWRYSVENGSQQSWSEFSGKVMTADNVSGVGKEIKTTGSILILSPSQQLSLPSFLSSGSIGNFNFQFDITITNPYDVDMQPEVCVICANAGIMTLQAGTALTQTGLLTKQMVLDAQQKSSVDTLSSSQYQRMVGGKSLQSGSSAVKKMIMENPRKAGGAMSAAGHADKLSKYYQE
jgi:hypothetical protein